jgi:hypothetical protein
VAEDDNQEPGPYIHTPDELEDDVRNGLMCFLDTDRMCGADCMAFTTQRSESPYLNHQQQNCAVIVGVERLGRYAGGIMKILRDDKADRARENQKPPPSPAG